MKPGGAPPDAVVLSSDVEVLVFSLMRLLPGAAKPRIVLGLFIFTTRASGWANRLRVAYYRFVLRRVWLAICHSELEVARYGQMFAGCGTRFRYVPWGGHVPTAAELGGDVRHDPSAPLVVSAGRSNRDYPTLVEASARAGCRLVIVCNDESALRGVTEGPAVEIRRNCFGADYMRELLAADVVAVPLAVEDISAGQMVFIQAMALGRPTVITRTPTVADYVTDNETALLVPRGDTAALASAIRTLIDDTARAQRIGDAGRRLYQERFNPHSVARDAVAVITGELAAASRTSHARPDPAIDTDPAAGAPHR